MRQWSVPVGAHQAFHSTFDNVSFGGAFAAPLIRATLMCWVCNDAPNIPVTRYATDVNVTRYARLGPSMGHAIGGEPVACRGGPTEPSEAPPTRRAARPNGS